MTTQEAYSRARQSPGWRGRREAEDLGHQLVLPLVPMGARSLLSKGWDVCSAGEEHLQC